MSVDAMQSEGFACRLSRELMRFLFDKLGTKMSNEEWALIFARASGANLTTSECGYDVTKGGVAWCAKTLANFRPHFVRHADLSFDGFDVGNNFEDDPRLLGEMLLGRWNEKIAELRKKFSETRVAVLVKGEDFSAVSAFEVEMAKFPPDGYEWEWDQDETQEGFVLHGYKKGTNVQCFTWQPGRMRLVVKIHVPDNRLKLHIKRPLQFDWDDVLSRLDFNRSWVEGVK